MEIRACANCINFEHTCFDQELLERKHDGTGCLNWIGPVANDYAKQLGEKLAKAINESIEDNVNHPSHYETGKYECIDVMLETQGVEAVKSFCICNAFKYIYRHNGKNGDEDIRKAKWYIDKYLELSRN